MVVGVELVVFTVLDELLVAKVLDFDVVAGIGDVEVGVIDLLEVVDDGEVTALAIFIQIGILYEN